MVEWNRLLNNDSIVLEYFQKKDSHCFRIGRDTLLALVLGLGDGHGPAWELGRKSKQSVSYRLVFGKVSYKSRATHLRISSRK